MARMHRLTLAELEAEAAKRHGPGGLWRYDSYSRSTQLKIRRELKAQLLEPHNTSRDKARIRGSLAGIEACLEAGKEDAKLSKRVTFRQEGGDDGYQYVIRVDGIAKWNGLTRSEAIYYKSLEVKRLKGQS